MNISTHDSKSIKHSNMAKVRRRIKNQVCRKSKIELMARSDQRWFYREDSIFVLTRHFHSSLLQLRTRAYICTPFIQFLAFVVCLRRQSKRFQRSWRLKRCETSRLVKFATFERRSIAKAIFPLYGSIVSTRFFCFLFFQWINWTYLFIILATRSSIRYDISQRHFVFDTDQVLRRNK